MSIISTNGGIGNTESLTGAMGFYTIRTLVSLEAGSVGTATDSAKRNLVRLINSISMGAQPVLVSIVVENVDLSSAPIRAQYGFGTNFTAANTPVATVKFAVEHEEVFGKTAQINDLNIPYTLAARLQGLPFTFGTVNVVELTNAATKNTVITGFDIL